MACTVTVQAQSFIPNDYTSYYFNPQNLGFATPQTAELAKYNPSGVDHYNGLLDFELPIMSYKDASFDIPITIKYISDGFKPGRRPSIIGNNWILNVGGVITRNVNGSPDDVRPSGLLVAIRDGKYKYHSKEDLFNLAIAKAPSGNPYGFQPLEHDYTPDVFNVSFGGHQGYFFIGNDGNIKSNLGEGFIFDISGLAIQSYSTTNAPTSSIIKITTPNGYIYEFGGDTSYLEYNIPNNPKGIKESPVQITSWHFKSIRNINNKRTAVFGYKKVEQLYKYKLFISSHWRQEVHTSPDPPLPERPIQRLSGGSSDCILIKDRLQTPIISSIIIDDVSVIFDTQAIGKFYSDETAEDLFRLTKITESCGNAQKSVSFEYRESGNYFFLQQLKLNSQAADPDIYTFGYNLYYPTFLPDSQTIYIDHWGFWSGRDTTEENANSYLDNINNRKKVNTSVASISMLNTITSPTKGTTIITYEPNSYNYWISKGLDNRIEWNMNHNPSSTPCGGVRVAKITEHDPITIEKTSKTYHYTTLAGASSGIVGVLPQYSTPEEVIQYHPKSKYANGQTYTIRTYEWYWSRSSNTNDRLSNVFEHHIGYSDVIEQYSDSSRIHYHFSSRHDVPDDESFGWKVNNNWNNIQSRSFSVAQLMSKYGVYNAGDMSGYRGKLLSKTIYSPKNEILSGESYTYNNHEWLNNYEISIASSQIVLASNRLFYTPCRRVKEIQTDAYGVEIHKMYSYNAKNLVSEKRTIQSNGDTLQLSYVYPFENSATTSGIYYLTNLVQQNRIDEPVLTIKSLRRKNTSTSQVLSAAKFYFEIFNNMVLKSDLFEWTLDNPATIAHSIENGNFRGKEQYARYDNYSNVTCLIRVP